MAKVKGQEDRQGGGDKNEVSDMVGLGSAQGAGQRTEYFFLQRKSSQGGDDRVAPGALAQIRTLPTQAQGAFDNSDLIVLKACC